MYDDVIRNAQIADGTGREKFLGDVAIGGGCAPTWPDNHDLLIQRIEGVEDIPGTALAGDIVWNWAIFPEYPAMRDGCPGGARPGQRVRGTQSAPSASNAA